MSNSGGKRKKLEISKIQGLLVILKNLNLLGWSHSNKTYNTRKQSIRLIQLGDFKHDISKRDESIIGELWKYSITGEVNARMQLQQNANRKFSSTNSYLIKFCSLNFCSFNVCSYEYIVSIQI